MESRELTSHFTLISPEARRLFSVALSLSCLNRKPAVSRCVACAVRTFLPCYTGSDSRLIDTQKVRVMGHTGINQKLKKQIVDSTFATHENKYTQSHFNVATPFALGLIMPTHRSSIHCKPTGPENPKVRFVSATIFSSSRCGFIHEKVNQTRSIRHIPTARSKYGLTKNRTTPDT